MKRFLRGFIALLALLRTTVSAAEVAPSSATAAGPATNEGPWLMAYFRQRYPTRIEIDASGKIHEVPLPDPMQVEQLHFAVSTNGRHWTPLNDNRPVWDQRLRDPFLRRGPDGRWHLLGTGRAPGTPQSMPRPVCLHAASADLITWDTVESLPLMAGVKDAEGRPARNIWAPEWFLDEKSGEFFVVWSSSFEDAGWKKSRLWFSRTKDWKTFTPAEVLFAPPYSVIDGSLLERDGTFYLFHKEEEFGVATGERRAIRVATAERLEGPYQILEGPLNRGQIVPTITEGPSVMPDPKGQGWLLLYDYCMTDRFGASSSKDLLHWKVEEDVSFPPDARHGSFFKPSPKEVARLMEAFGRKN